MNANTLLYRQIHPNFIQQDRVSSQAFRPTPKDEQKLSVYDGDQIEPAPAYQHYTGKLNLPSVGVMAVTVLECQESDLLTRPDPAPFPEHALIDFSAYSKNETEKKAKLLKAKAEARNWLYREVMA
jgi:hypothetical protein